MHAASDSTRPLLEPVVDADGVSALREAGRHVVVADVRWYLDGRDGRAAYEAGHLPGAVFVDLDVHLARHDLPATEGRHPFPTPEAFAASMMHLGIGDDTVVVGYDDGGGMTAGRLVVMLRMLGRDAAVLDGGLTAWTGPLETGPGTATDTLTGTGTGTGTGAGTGVVSFTPRPWPTSRLASDDEVVRAPGGAGVSIDARSYERFTGRVASIDPRPGHIPGGRSAPWDAVLDSTTRRFLPPTALAAHFAGLGITEGTDVIASCGSGVSACMNILAMERAGLTPPRLYVASFSGWCADPTRPVVTDP
jgi:thiosulfate/3-mercaptopyruvate sulfurtransferase